MSKLFLTLTLLLCCHVSCLAKDYEYKWEEYKIDEKLLPSISSISKATIKITAASSSVEKILWVKWGRFKYHGSDTTLADAIHQQLAKELGKAGINENGSSARSLEIFLKPSRIEEGSYNRAVTLDFTVKCGDGGSFEYSIRNSAPGVPYRAYNGAVALAVIKILNAPDILKYLK